MTAERSEPDGRVTAALRQYLEAQDAGGRPDRAALLAEHPDLADDLAAFFEETDRLAGCAAWLGGTPAGTLRSAPPPGASGPPPWRFAGYELLEEVGRGGMGVVYKARQAGTSRTVAVKLLRADDPVGAARLLAEARAAARLDHPGIVPIFEVGEHAGRPFLAMAFVDGASLAARLGRGPLPPRDAARVVRDAARAVQHAHDQGVIHRDLKPANVLLEPDGRVRVTDFGLAKRVASGECDPPESALTADGAILGTPAYMPPEFAAGGSATAGPAADVYGLGAVLYALLTGRPPFAGPTPLDTLRRVAETDPTPPRELDPRIDRGLQAVCLRCLEKDPSHRYPSARELAADLDRYLAGEPPLAEHLGWGQWLGRQFARATDFPHARRWSRLLAALAALVAFAHVLFYAGTRDAAAGWVFWAWFLGVELVTTWVPCAVAAGRWRHDPREREVLLFWVGVSVGRLVLFANHCPLSGEVAAAEVYRFFPAALVLYGVMLFAEGRPYWGRLYLLGLSEVAAAVLLMHVPSAVPVVYGLWHAAVLVVIARHLRRVAARYDRVPREPPESGGRPPRGG
jgi:tRNA A-37 threonylcarbamoyl transferase component Bud32